MSNDIIYKGRPSKILILIEFIKMLFLMAFLAVTLNFLDGKFAMYDAIPAIPLVVMGLFALLASLKILYITYTVFSVSYTLSTETFELKTGLLSIRRDSLELYRIKDTSIHQPFVYRFFGLANLVLYTSDVSTPTITLRAIRNFDKLVDDLRTHVEKARATSILETI